MGYYAWEGADRSNRPASVSMIELPSWVSGFASSPWRFGMVSVARALAAHSDHEAIPAAPNRYEHEPLQGIAYWSALYYVLKYTFGWREIALGMERWGELKSTVTASDPRVRLVEEVWLTDPFVETFKAQMWLSSRLPSGQQPQRTWFREMERLAENVSGLPYGGGSDPLHFATADSTVAGENTNQNARLVFSTSDRRATLIVSEFDGWLFELRRCERQLDNDGHRSWHVDVVAQDAGWLGTFRKSWVTGLWFSGKHSSHMIGNIPEQYSEGGDE